MEAVPGARQLNRFAPIGRWRADAGSLHAPTVVDGRRARWLEVDRPALVLGSAQDPATVDQRAAADAGVEVVRRRSGGGAVLLWPGEHLWLDVEVPRDDPLWDDDIGRSMHWLGEVWAAAVKSLGGHAEVHRHGMVRTSWSAEVCFAGVGPGELTSGGAKVVGISQRRTRDGARLQSLCHLRWRPDVYAAVFGADVAELAGCAAEVRGTPAAIEAAVTAALTER